MNVSIQDLPAEVIASYQTAAHDHGMELEAFLREHLIRNAPPPPPAPPPLMLSPEEWEKEFDEFVAFFSTDNGPFPDDAFDRENIYGREDNWRG